MTRGKGGYHESMAERNKEKVYDALWRAGYGFGGLGLMETARRAGVNELTARRRLRELIPEGRVARRLDGYKVKGIAEVEGVIFSTPEVILTPIRWEGSTIMLPVPLQEKPKWERMDDKIEERTRHRPKGPYWVVKRKSLSRSIRRIMRGTDMPRPLKRPYYATTSRLFPLRPGADADGIVRCYPFCPNGDDHVLRRATLSEFQPFVVQGKWLKGRYAYCIKCGKVIQPIWKTRQRDMSHIRPD